MSFRISRGVLTGLQDALGIRELSDASAALIATLGITLAASTVIMPMVVVSAIGTIMEVISVINSVYMAASAVKGIYSTAMGAGNRYDKAEAFAHDATMLAVSLIFLWGTASAIKNSTALFKSASQNLIGRTSRLTPSEVTQTYKGARLLTSFDDFAEYTKGFLDDDALQYAREVLGNDGDDIAGLKKIAQLIEDGSQKIGRKLSKEELKTGLDALWDDAGVEGALAAMERCFKWGPNVLIDIDKIRPQLETKPNTAFFWSGKTDGVGGAETAARIAKKRGGVTLESIIEEKNIIMPEWDFQNPSTMQAWDLASEAYAEQVSGEVHAVIGSKLRKGNIWENVELPRLKENLNVTKIITIDPKTGIEKIVFER